MAVYSFSRRCLPDLVTEELVFVLSQKRSYEFKQLFEVVHDNLRRRNAAYGGEEMLRLRAYDKLQKLVFGGAVKKSGKIYTGNSAALATMAANAPHADPVKSNAYSGGRNSLDAVLEEIAKKRKRQGVYGIQS
jgi:hypothetical protein